MRLSQSATVLAAITTSALLLSACTAPRTEDSIGAEVLYPLAEASGELTGEGASSEQSAMDNVFGPAFSWTGATLAYNATGSGSGQSQFIAGLVDFAGSDSALNEEQAEQAYERCNDNPAWHLPTVIGPIAIAYHLDSLGEDETLNISVETLVQIFQGEITNWNDAAIAAENPGVDLPDQTILVVYRSDESGTSDNFQKFLSAASDGAWTSSGKSFPTAVGSGANGSTGVAGQVAATDGAITYVESGYAKNSDTISVANIDFGSGPVELNQETVNNALAAVEFSGEGNDLIVDTESLYAQDGADEYPLVLTTYQIVCSAGYDENTANLVKNFLYVMLSNQGDELEELGYIPISGAFYETVEAAVEAMQ